MIAFLLSAVMALQAPQLTPDNIRDVVAAMTLEEKAAVLVGGGSKAFNGIGNTDTGVPGAAGTTHAVPRLGIPSIVLADGPAGLRIDPMRAGVEKTFFCTGFPIGTMLASTWNTELVEEVGRAIGNEVLEYGVDVILGPGVNIHRNPLCGRNFEYYSEDPLLAGEMAAAMIAGIQSNGVGTSMKHFAVNSQELNRLHNDARLSERALREIYLRNFEIAVRKAQPWTIMTSYNYINGIHASESPDLLTDVLRDEWGFEGVVMTDWGGGYDTAEQIHAGNEMIQPGSDRRYQDIIDAVGDGRLAIEDVDRSVARVLELVVKSPKFRGYVPSEAPDLTAHAAVCRKAADEGVVLMKNSGGALPLSRGEKIALFGVTSYQFIAGGTGSGDVHRPYVVDLRQGLSNAGFLLDMGVDSFYAEYMDDEAFRCNMINGKNPWYIDRERPLEVVSPGHIGCACVGSDKAVITFGRVFGEGKDRDRYYSYSLQEGELDLLKQVSYYFHKEGKQVIVILNIGGVVDMTPWQDMADAILICSVNPSGRLPMTISKAYEYEPSAPNFPQVLADKPFNYSFYRRLADNKKSYDIKNVDFTEYEEGIYVGYRHFQTFAPRHVAYPFGYGLSYTSFKWSGMTVAEAGDGWDVTVEVKNTGSVAGKDVVELFVHAPGKDMDKPERELKAFAKTPLLEPGEAATVALHVTRDSLASWDEEEACWVVESGRYRFLACRDAATPVLRKRVRL